MQEPKHELRCSRPSSATSSVRKHGGNQYRPAHFQVAADKIREQLYNRPQESNQVHTHHHHHFTKPSGSNISRSSHSKADINRSYTDRPAITYPLAPQVKPSHYNPVTHCQPRDLIPIHLVSSAALCQQTDHRGPMEYPRNVGSVEKRPAKGRGRKVCIDPFKSYFEIR